MEWQSPFERAGGTPPDDPRLAPFREFINSLDIDLPGEGGELRRS